MEQNRQYIAFNVSKEEALAVIEQLEAEPGTKRFIDGLKTAKTFRRAKNGGLLSSEAKYLSARVYSGADDLYDLMATAYNIGYRRGYLQSERNHRKGANL
ncbi:MAG: hypothetical protein K6G12_03160 [Lachnospiraceae bacterium]|nr:hypothetical protein [Lachnospiraceae bacterium]